MRYQPDRYYLYDEMTAWLETLPATYPGLCELRTLGESPEGRTLHLLVLTDLSQGPPESKPAYWIDANTHASEVMGSAAALYTIDHVLRNADKLGDLLGPCTLYIAPRINPDGAEFCLTTGQYVRSARRLWPEEYVAPGLHPGDVDGDGEALQMRQVSPDGPWKVHPEDARLLVRRDPWDTQGPFYHLWAEGTFEPGSEDDQRLPVADTPYQLDFNRNYPYKWSNGQRGAGDFPLSEPEARAVVTFLTQHRNVCGMLTYHTFSGVLLRPYSDRPDDQMPGLDKATFDLIGARCETHTGFACKSCFHHFCYDPNNLTTGAFDDWAYDRYGVHCYTMELWSPWRQAGLDFSDRLLDFFAKRTPEDDLAMLRWNDDAVGGRMFEPWRPFEHPQLGAVEIGGWRTMYSFRNAPPELLADECHATCLFSLDHARSLPRPKLTLEAQALAGDLYEVTATLSNTGYLPTDVTAHARAQGLVRPGHLELKVEGCEIVRGQAHQRVGPIDGYARVHAEYPSSSHAGGQARPERRHRWLLRGQGEVVVTWHGDRLGRRSARVVVG